ncbi:MAG: hypothetical protein WA658_13560, partial [Candidatus Acidiferrales bacterium]
IPESGSGGGFKRKFTQASAARFEFEHAGGKKMFDAQSLPGKINRRGFVAEVRGALAWFENQPNVWRYSDLTLHRCGPGPRE